MHLLTSWKWSGLYWMDYCQYLVSYTGHIPGERISPRYLLVPVHFLCWHEDWHLRENSWDPSDNLAVTESKVRSMKFQTFWYCADWRQFNCRLQTSTALAGKTNIHMFGNSWWLAMDAKGGTVMYISHGTLLEPYAWSSWMQGRPLADALNFCV